MSLYLMAAILAVPFVFAVLLAVLYRVVVPTNYVHIVQSRRSTVSYGKGQTDGNVYYRWPSWVPRWGVKVIQFPVSVFPVQLSSYAAYDKGRVPFVVDVLAFFRIEDPNTAAQRISSFEELVSQLEGILQGASRSILAQSPIEEILEERAKYGKMFTEATDEQLRAWGVANVKNVELMDIRDAANSHVIQHIMAIKQSLIERDSRTNVANNMQLAKTAEIDAQRTVLVREQEAAEQVGIRTAQKDQQVGIASQQSQQAIKEQEKTTAEKQMAVTQVQKVRNAEIERDVQVVNAEQEKRTAVIKAEGEKQRTVTIAEGNLGMAKLNAEGIEVEGKARGAAEQAVLMAPVNSQIALAKEIGENEGYQSYLISVKKVEAAQTVGVEQAKALASADIKVISNTGSPSEGLTNVMDLFTPKGGTTLGAALEAVANTPTGRAITEKLGLNGSEAKHS